MQQSKCENEEALQSDSDGQWICVTACLEVAVHMSAHSAVVIVQDSSAVLKRFEDHS